jgi:hypothetical protein
MHAVPRAHWLSVDSAVVAWGGRAVTRSVCGICHRLLLVNHLTRTVRLAGEGELSFGGDGVRCGLLQETDVLLALLRGKRPLFRRGLNCL